MYKEFYGLTGKPVQRQSGSALSISDAAYGGGAGMPDLRNPEPQRVRPADRRSGNRQDHAHQ